MKVYYTCSTAEFNKYKGIYFKIRDIIVSQKHVLTRDWLVQTEQKIKTSDMTEERIKIIYKECIKSLKEADVVIIEDTVSNFSTGHQITLALEMQKPTLVLWKGVKHKYFQKMFIHGVDNEYLEVKQYTPENLEEILKIFLEKYENINQKNRFHLVLNNMERNYLDWVQFNKGISRTKIIKNALKREIDTDQKYLDYLVTKK